MTYYELNEFENSRGSAKSINPGLTNKPSIPDDASAHPRQLRKPISFLLPANHVV